MTPSRSSACKDPPPIKPITSAAAATPPASPRLGPHLKYGRSLQTPMGNMAPPIETETVDFSSLSSSSLLLAMQFAGRRVLVCGTGNVAIARAEMLCRCSARVELQLVPPQRTTSQVEDGDEQQIRTTTMDPRIVVRPHDQPLTIRDLKRLHAIVSTTADSVPSALVQGLSFSYRRRVLSPEWDSDSDMDANDDDDDDDSDDDDDDFHEKSQDALRGNSDAAFLARACRRSKVLLCVAGRPDISDFSFPAMARHGHVQMAVSTGGLAPMLAKRIKDELALQIPDQASNAVARIAHLRNSLRYSEQHSYQGNSSSSLARLCATLSWQQLASLGSTEECNEAEKEKTLTELRIQEEKRVTIEAEEDRCSKEKEKGTDLRTQQEKTLHENYASQDRNMVATVIEKKQQHISTSHGNERARKGKMFLVGAGPGDAKLLTLRATELLAMADLVLADRLVPQEILQLIRCEWRMARKTPGNADPAQHELNAWGLEALAQGKNVVRLKCGDPFVFGRGGEEMDFYHEAGFECEVVPGISSCLAAPLSAGIAVTRRGCADRLLVCTGVGAQGASVEVPPFHERTTVVMLMSVGRATELNQAMLDTGYPSDLPIAIVERATDPDERAIFGTIDQLQSLITKHQIRPPSVLVIGRTAVAPSKVNHLK